MEKGTGMFLSCLIFLMFWSLSMQISMSGENELKTEQGCGENLTSSNGKFNISINAVQNCFYSFPKSVDTFIVILLNISYIDYYGIQVFDCKSTENCIPLEVLKYIILHQDKGYFLSSTGTTIIRVNTSHADKQISAHYNEVSTEMILNVSVDTKSINVTEGENFTIECKITYRFSHPTVIWQKKNADGIKNIHTNDREHSYNIVATDTERLTITNASMSDQGIYTCQATNEIVANVSRSVDVTIIELGFNLKVTIKKRSFTVHEGEKVHIECQADAVFISGRLDFHWTLNGIPINPTRNSRIQAIYKRKGSTTFVSSLRIVDFKENDGGIFECSAHLKDIREVANITIMVYRYTLESSSMATLNGTNISVTCTLFPTNKLANNTLEFCEDGKKVKGEDPRITFAVNRAVLEIVALFRDTSISCGWTNYKNCSQHKKIDIAVFNQKYTPCPNQIDSRHIEWPETFPGIIATRNCQSGYIGTVSRECRKSGYLGKWNAANYINCTRKKIAEVENKLDRIKDGVGIDKLVNVIQEFKEESKAILQTNVTASDVRSGVQVLATVSDIVTNRVGQIGEEETVEFFEATDVILSGDSGGSWQDLYKATGENSAALVMDIVANVADKALKTLTVDRPISIVGENFVLQIENANKSAIGFPRKESYGIKSSVLFSEETIRTSLNVTDSVKYSAAYYKTLGSFFPKGLTKGKIGSPIIAFSVPDEDIIKKLDPPIRMTFETTEVTNLTERLCLYWDTSLASGKSWREDGCRVGFVNDTFTECFCDHLTNFAVVISVKELSETHHKVMSIMSLVGFIVSLVCLILTISVHFIYWRQLKSDKAVILLILCISLVMAYLTFIVGVERTENKTICTAVALTLHYMFLVVLFLMASEGVLHAWLVFVVFPQNLSINRILIPVSFGTPLLIVVISGSVTRLNGYGTDQFCWLGKDNGLIYSFLGPCAAVVLINTIIMCLMLEKRFSTRAMMNRTMKQRIKTGVRSLMVLAPIFGVTWLFGFFVFHEDTVVFAYLFVFCNSLQGALIFLMHTCMNQTVKKVVKRSLSNLRRQQGIVTVATSFRRTNPTDTKSKTDDAESELSASTLLSTNTKQKPSSVIIEQGNTSEEIQPDTNDGELEPSAFNPTHKNTTLKQDSVIIERKKSTTDHKQVDSDDASESTNRDSSYMKTKLQQSIAIIEMRETTTKYKKDTNVGKKKVFCDRRTSRMSTTQVINNMPK